MRIRLGLAGWSNPPTKQLERDRDQTHLSYYAEHFSCVEINSSFYRPHQSATYAGVSRVAADPARCPGAELPGGARHAAWDDALEFMAALRPHG